VVWFFVDASSFRKAASTSPRGAALRRLLGLLAHDEAIRLLGAG
jgi:hypothetical protein